MNLIKINKNKENEFYLKEIDLFKNQCMGREQIYIFSGNLNEYYSLYFFSH